MPMQGRARRPTGSMRLLAIIAAVGVATGIVGWQLGGSIRSPEQIEATSDPPPPSQITAEVELRALRDVLSTRGVVASSNEVAISVLSAGNLVATRVLVEVGDTVGDGDVILELSGRPLVLMAGSIPFYRDLHEGLVGEDVRQLEDALLRLGFLEESNDVLDQATRAGIIRFYRSLGYEPVPADATQRQQWYLAAARVREAEERAKAAEGQASSAAAQRELIAARKAMADLENRTPLLVPAAEFVAVAALPSQIMDLTVVLGQPISNPILTLAGGPLVINASLTPAQQALVEVGDPAAAITPNSGDTYSGTVSNTALVDSGDGVSYQAVIQLDSATADLAIGADVQVDITIESGQESLVVPVTAIHSNGSGQLYVDRVDDRGNERRVEVTTGRTIGGFVELGADTTLKPGDMVKIGAP